MKYKLEDDGLYCQVDKKWQRIGGWIRVLARTRLTNKRHGHGLLLEWKNMDGVKLREVIYARDLNGDQARQIRELLVDTGYPLTPGQSSWSRLQHYLLGEMVNAEPAIVLNRSGWHNQVFATSSGVIGETVEPHYFVGQLATSAKTEASGNLKEWQERVGTLCQGNPLAIFSVGVALAAPLLAQVGMENGAFHLVGSSSTGKTTLQRVAASVYGGPQYLRGWVSTANGLEAVAAQHHDMSLLLDEIGMARPEDVDLSVYQIMNGTGKLRATMAGDLAPSASWRTMLLSTGEVWICEVLERIGKHVRAGQQARLVEIPVFGKYGVFEDLHEHRTAAAFVDTVNANCSQFYGTLFPEWIKLLQGLHTLCEGDDIDLKKYLINNVRIWSEHWCGDQMASQVDRVVKRFALVCVALCLCCRNFMLPWTEKESQDAVHRTLNAWLNNRGHSGNSEEFRILKALEGAMKSWERKLTNYGRPMEGLAAGLRRNVNGDELWLIKKNTFLSELSLPVQYMREVQILLQKECLFTNEPSRGTYRVKIDDQFHRFFALRPEQVRQLLASLEGESDEA